MIKHKFVSTLADDGALPGAVTPSAWNDAHRLLEGSTGQVVIRDQADLVDGMRVGTLPIAGGGTGAINAKDARTNLDVYSKADVDSRVIQIPVQIPQGGTGASSALGARDQLNLFSRDQIQGGFAMTGLNLATNASLKSGAVDLIKADGGGIVHVGGAGATRVVADSPLSVTLEQWISAGGVEMLKASANPGPVTIGGAGVTRIASPQHITLGGAGTQSDPSKAIVGSGGTPKAIYGNGPEPGGNTFIGTGHVIFCAEAAHFNNPTGGHWNGDIRGSADMQTGEVYCRVQGALLALDPAAVRRAVKQGDPLPGLTPPDAEGLVPVGGRLHEYAALLDAAEAALTEQERRLDELEAR